MKTYIIKDSKTGWEWASDELPNTMWTPERSDAQEYATRADADSAIKTLHPADQKNAIVQEVERE